MTKLSLTTAWNETVAFVKREARLLLPIALLLNALPMAVATASVPELRQGGTAQGGLWLLLVPLAAFVGTIGHVAISYLALRPGRTVGEALARGLKRFLPILGLYLLVGLALGIAMTLILVLVTLLFGVDTSAPRPEQLAGVAVLGIALVLPLMLFAATRLMFVTTVAAVEEGGPIAILRRTWALTGPVFWTLLGFLILSGILALVINIVAQTILGIPILIVSGPPRPGSLSGVVVLLLGALVSTVVTVFLTTMTARIYAQLAPREASGVFD